jgi:hypothetical protein
MFQDFGVVYPILAFMFRGQRRHLIVRSADEVERNRVAPPPINSPLGQIIARHYLYYFQLGDTSPSIGLAETGAVTTAVIAEWDRTCHAREMVLLGGVP